MANTQKFLVSTHIAPDLRERVKAAAALQGRSISSEIRLLLSKSYPKN